MGGWILEVGKMAIYMSFPVALFHYFNQPQYFEKWVTEKKRELYPPEAKGRREELAECIRRVRVNKDKEIMNTLEEFQKRENSEIKQ